MTPDILMRRGRVQASEDYPYFSAGLWSMRLVPYPGLAKVAMGPVGVDEHWRVYYDPMEVSKMTVEGVAAVWVHEVGHLIRGHADRREARLPAPWNIAGDLEINDDFPNISAQLPWVVMPHLYGLQDGDTAERYYAQLEDNAKAQKGKSHDCGSACDGIKRKYEGPTDGEGEEALGEHDAEAIRAQVAEEVHKMRGMVPAGLARWADDFLKPTANWKTILRRMVTRAIRTKAGCVDYSYRRPARRQWGNVILPTMIAPEVLATIVVDTSGSMSKQDVSQCLAETKGICKAVGAVPTVFFVDASVASKTKATPDLYKKVRGGGGTDMRVGIEAALEERPDVIVVLTDGETPWPERPPGVPIVAGIVEGNSMYRNIGGYAVEAPAWLKTVKIPVS